MYELIVLFNGKAVFESVRQAYGWGLNTSDVNLYDEEKDNARYQAFEDGRKQQETMN